jgi:hypothetical protein
LPAISAKNLFRRLHIESKPKKSVFALKNTIKTSGLEQSLGVVKITAHLPDPSYYFLEELAEIEEAVKFVKSQYPGPDSSPSDQ